MNIAEQELFCPPRCHIIGDFGTAPFGASVPTAVKDRPSVHIHTVNRVSHLPPPPLRPSCTASLASAQSEQQGGMRVGPPLSPRCETFAICNQRGRLTADDLRKLTQRKSLHVIRIAVLILSRRRHPNGASGPITRSVEYRPRTHRRACPTPAPGMYRGDTRRSL